MKKLIMLFLFTVQVIQAQLIYPIKCTYSMPNRPQVFSALINRPQNDDGTNGRVLEGNIYNQVGDYQDSLNCFHVPGEALSNFECSDEEQMVVMNFHINENSSRGYFNGRELEEVNCY